MVFICGNPCEIRYPTRNLIEPLLKESSELSEHQVSLARNEFFPPITHFETEVFTVVNRLHDKGQRRSYNLCDPLRFQESLEEAIVFQTLSFANRKHPCRMLLA